MATSSDPENKATHDNELQIGESIAEDLSAGGIGAAVDDEASTAIFYRTKVVEFLGRSTQIVLQNDNGPCPLLAICNVLLLRNVIELSLDISEVSQQKLLSLVAERLLDSNSNLEGKDEGYVSNQQRNISDAIDLLPRLASGIDVNVLFRKIDDFEFTRECAIFDLLDIGLYHGWIVDPQDVETATAIGSKSYNALVGQLVALDTKSPKEENFLPDEEPVDFAAAATAALGVPSPSLSRSLSLNDRIIRRGDLEEEEVLMRVLKLSSGEQAASVAESVTSVINMTDQIASNAPPGSSETSTSPHVSLADGDNIACLPSAKIVEISTTTNFEDSPINIKADGSSYYPAETDGSSPHASEGHAMESRENGSIAQDCMPEKLTTQAPKNADNISNDALPVSDLHDSCGRQDVSEDLYSDHNDVEPLYEGEECILDSAIPKYEDREPVYEGESVLGKHVEQDETTSEQQWHLVKTFLKENASQLTIYGLFCLQEGLKERELCIFFRNNHFSTMFKYNGELYLLATDQGYINQQNLVWEKLNEVNGDTMFVRSDFNQFLPEDQLNQTWDDQHGINDLFAMDGSTSGNSTFKSDLELAKELQKQEFEKQPPRSQMAPKVPQSSASGSSRLIVGPQNSRHTSNTPPRPESKSKDKCVLM